MTVTAGSTTGTASTTTEPSAETTAAVAELQQVMTDLGYYDGPIDGVYGDATTEGVKKMQTDLGVTADGVYGAETHDALKGKGKSIVMELQTELQTYGYYDGEDRRGLRAGDPGRGQEAPDRPGRDRGRQVRPRDRRCVHEGRRRRHDHAEVVGTASVASAISRTTSTMSRFAL